MSTYTLFNVIAAGDPVDPVLYPNVTSDLQVVPDPDDDPLTTRTATKILVEMETPGKKPGKLSEFSEIKAEVAVTNSRLLVHCEKFDTGTTYGDLNPIGAAIGLVATGVSKFRAKHRNQGLILVGHIRYPWLHSVGGFENRILGNLLVARVVTKTTHGPITLKLTLFLTRGSGAVGLATEIAQKAAAYNLKHAEVPENIAPQLTSIASGRTQPVKDKKAGTTGYEMPWSQEVVSF